MTICRGTPTQLNSKQSVAFDLIRRLILNVKVHGQDNVQQLLLNSRSFFVNTMKRFAKEELGRDGFMQAAAPSDTAAYIINGKTQSPLFACWHEQVFAIAWGEAEGHAGHMVGQKIFTMVSKRLQGARSHYHLEISRWSSWGTSSSWHKSAILRYSRQMPLILADTTYTRFLTRLSPLPNLCDSKERTKQTSGHNWRAWMRVCLRKKTGVAGGVETSTCFPQQRRQSSWTMPSLHVLGKRYHKA